MSFARPARVPATAGGAARDLVVVGALGLLSFFVAGRVELSEWLSAWTARHERWQLDEAMVALLVLACGFAWYAGRRWRELRALLACRWQAERRAEALARQLIAAQENERRRIARELHDELGQRCVAIRAEAACLSGALGAAERARAVAAVSASADALYDGVHRLLCELRPAELDSLGLSEALHALCARSARLHALDCHAALDAACDELPEPLAIALYRSAQEALTNAVRHGRAAAVALRVYRDGAAIALSVRDDGCGFDPTAAHEGFGLLGMRERVAALGGAVFIDSDRGAGTHVTVTLPVPA